ncbi:MAG: type II toxin-antitoxin system Phd/YefM family antitoxin [Candidatus Levyibacteriota bacterium]
MSNFIAISDARATLPELVEKVNKHNDEFVITVNGKPKAVMVSFEELESLRETAEILAIPGAKKEIEEGLKEARKGLGIPLSELK